MFQTKYFCFSIYWPIELLMNLASHIIRFTLGNVKLSDRKGLSPWAQRKQTSITLGSQCLQFMGLFLTTCVDLGQLFNHSVPQFLQLQTKSKTVSCLTLVVRMMQGLRVLWVMPLMVSTGMVTVPSKTGILFWVPSGMVAHTLNPSTQEAEVAGPL